MRLRKPQSFTIASFAAAIGAVAKHLLGSVVPVQKPAELAAIMHRRIGRRNFVRPELNARRLLDRIAEVGRDRGIGMRDRVRSHRAVLILLAMALSASSLPAWAAELKVLAPNAVKEALSEIASHFEQVTKHKLLLSRAGSEAISKRVSEGEVFDVVVNTSAGVDRLGKEGKLSAGSKRDFSRSAVAVAVKAGVPRPDVSTVEGLSSPLMKSLWIRAHLVR
jgi:Bacterial extracellular solute-binding protein